MNNVDYWQETLDAALTDAGIAFTLEQLKSVAIDCANSHDMYSECMGHDQIPNPLEGEIRELKKKLKHEQSLVYCNECQGRGRTWSQGPVHGCDRTCWKCNGEGKHLP